MSTRRRLAVSLVAAAAAASAVPLLVGSNASSAPAPAQCPSQPSYFNTIPTPVGPPATVSGLEGGGGPAVGVAALGSDRKLYYVESDISEDPLPSSALACLGGLATDAPAVALGADDSRAFFVRAANGTIYQRYVTVDYSSTGAFTPVNNAATTSGPAAVQTANGQWHLFVRGLNGALYHGFRQTSSLSSWRFESLGGQIVGQPAAIVDGTRILVAATTPGGAIYTIRGTNFAWGPWAKVVAPIAGNNPTQVKTNTPPSLVRNPFTAQITMYAAHVNQGLFAITKQANTAFSGFWVRIDTLLPSDARIAAATDGDNSIVYARFLDRPSGQYVLAYTQFRESEGEWSDYFLAPYACYNCAPDLSTVDAEVSSKSAKNSPGKGKLAEQPRTKRVLGG
jgi:Repeat of unknown function (DUF346)